MTSLRRDVVVRGLSVVVTTLALLGLATAGLLDRRTRTQQDEALVLAAHGGASDEGWSVDHGPPPVRVRDLTRPADDAEAARMRRARATERPQFFDRGREHGVVVVVERERGHREEHRLIEAAAPKLTVADTVGPFLLAYLPLGTAASALAGLALTYLVRRALLPLDRARAELEGIRGPTSGARLTEGGPEEVRVVVTAFNELLDRLEAAHRAQERFTSEAAHELRTPVTALRLVLELARRHSRTPEQHQEDLAELDEASARLQEVVEGLLVLARLDAGREVPPAVRAAGDLVRDAAQHEGVDASLDGVGDERVVVHPELAAIALRNLVRNAARHGGSTRVVFRTRRVGDLVRIEVEDRGPGVPPEAREQVFDTLARGARARADDPEGLGLGLPLARRIARSEGGDCVLEAGAQGGTCAVLLLPSA